MNDTADRLYERVLVVRCKAGSDAAFVELVEHFGPRLRYYLRKMLSRDEVEDALQDVWLDVLRGIGRLVDIGAFPAWVYRIARNRALQRLQKPPHVSVSLTDVEAVEDVPHDEPLSAEDADRIHAALDGLPVEQREVLVLRFMEGMSYEEVASVTGQPIGTVRSRLHYAKHALRRVLERMEDHGR